MNKLKKVGIISEIILLLLTVYIVFSLTFENYKVLIFAAIWLGINCVLIISRKKIIKGKTVYNIIMLLMSIFSTAFLLYYSYTFITGIGYKLNETCGFSADFYFAFIFLIFINTFVTFKSLIKTKFSIINLFMCIAIFMVHLIVYINWNTLIDQQSFEAIKLLSQNYIYLNILLLFSLIKEYLE